MTATCRRCSINKNGQRAPFTATRLSTFKDRKGDAITSAKDATEDGGSDVVLIIQVPLKTRPFARGSFAAPKSLQGLAVSPPAARVADGHLSDVETAVIGHGKTEGRFDEINGLNIERDSRFPIRITAQFYKATSNGIVSASDVAELRQQIDRVYERLIVGSLVIDTSNSRPTSWTDLQNVSSASLWSHPFGLGTNLSSRSPRGHQPCRTPIQRRPSPHCRQSAILQPVLPTVA